MDNDSIDNDNKTNAILFRTGHRNVTYPMLQIVGILVNFVLYIKCLGISSITLGLRRLYSCGLYLPLRVKILVVYVFLKSQCIYNKRIFELVLNRIVRYVF